MRGPALHIQSRPRSRIERPKLFRLGGDRVDCVDTWALSSGSKTSTGAGHWILNMCCPSWTCFIAQQHPGLNATCARCASVRRLRPARASRGASTFGRTTGSVVPGWCMQTSCWPRGSSVLMRRLIAAAASSSAGHCASACRALSRGEYGSWRQAMCEVGLTPCCLLALRNRL